MNDLRDKEPIHVAAGLIWKEGRMLITKRPEGKHLGGMWELPGGKKENHETLKMCLEREIKEELGMDIQAEKLILTVQHEYDKRLVILHLFECSCHEGSPRPLEGQEIKWVNPKDLKRYTFPPPDQKIFEFLFKLF